MSFEELEERALGFVEEMWGRAVELSDELAENPEISGEEFAASRAHARLLEEAGYEVEMPFMGLPTAFRGERSFGSGGGPTVALLVEYDALPEIGHACGHNVSGAMSTLAAVALSRALEGSGVSGRILAFGTPAEERDGAKVLMAERGAFDEVDLAMMIHASGGASYVRYRSLAMDAIEFEFRGKASHAAASPWEGRNALNGVQLLFHAIDMLRQHVRPEARMHGIISKGGEAPNVVPELAAARFYFRAPWREYLNSLVEKAWICAQGCAIATFTEVERRPFELSFDNMLPTPRAEEVFEEILTELGVELSPSPGPQGSSDVGNVSHRCPTIQPMLDITGTPVALHTRDFALLTKGRLAHERIKTGAKALTRMALKVLVDPRLREEIRSSFLLSKERESRV